MNVTDVQRLIDWLGPEGAIAGLDASQLTVSELYELAVQSGSPVDRRMRRRDLVTEIVNGKATRIDKNSEELLAMNHDELREYFERRQVSTSELLQVLSRFNIRPQSEGRRHLVDFAAREISDLGMYERVAKGTRR